MKTHLDRGRLFLPLLVLAEVKHFEHHVLRFRIAGGMPGSYRSVCVRVCFSSTNYYFGL